MMATGTVKWFNPTKGYGFIQPQGGGKDVFVHISAVERAGLTTLNEGQHLEYEIEENRGKTSAVNLKVTGITLCLRRDAGRNASLAHRYNAFGGLWGCYDQIFGLRRHLPKLGNGLCGHSH